MTDNDEIKLIVEDLRKQREDLEKKRQELEKEREELKSLLSKASKMTTDEAKKQLLLELDEELTSEKAKKIRAAEERVRQVSKEKAQEILVDAMRLGAVSYVAEYAVSSVEVPNDEVKGRIIGKEGRNIRAFERVTQVELILDETNEIRLSSYDAIRREVAKRALLLLIKDSRIQPSRIEEVVKQVKNQLDQFLLEEGIRIAQDCGEYNLPTEILSLIGRFKFRTSFGQNLAIHTIEETKIGVAIANEIGANIEVVRLGCLLHDIGKVVTEEEGNHVDAGVAVLKKHGLPKEVVTVVSEHHEDKPFSSIESVIVWTADAISGSRPGARYEPHEGYISRMGKIEELANSFKGVDYAYAFQSGRDVRVIVKPDEIDDDGMLVLARDIAKKLEKEADYAGQIKVTTIRETRASESTAAK